MNRIDCHLASGKVEVNWNLFTSRVEILNLKLNVNNVSGYAKFTETKKIWMQKKAELYILVTAGGYRRIKEEIN